MKSIEKVGCSVIVTAQMPSISCAPRRGDVERVGGQHLVLHHLREKAVERGAQRGADAGIVKAPDIRVRTLAHARLGIIDDAAHRDLPERPGIGRQAAQRAKAEIAEQHHDALLQQLLLLRAAVELGQTRRRHVLVGQADMRRQRGELAGDQRRGIGGRQLDLRQARLRGVVGEQDPGRPARRGRSTAPPNPGRCRLAGRCAYREWRCARFRRSRYVRDASAAPPRRYPRRIRQRRRY